MQHAGKAGLLVGVLVLAWLAVAVGVRATYAGEVLPGTAVAGLPLGGADGDTAVRRLRSHARRPVRLVAPGAGVLSVSAADAGLLLDPEALTAEAMRTGRGGLGALLRAPVGLVLRRRVDLGAGLDLARTGRVGSLAAKRFGRRPFDGAVQVDPETLQAQATGPRPGRSVRRDVLQRRLYAALRDGADEVRVPLRRLPAAAPSAVRAVAFLAETYVREPVVLRAAGRSATLPPSAVAGLLRLRSTEGAVRLGVDAQAARDAVAGVLDRFGRPAREPRFRFGATMRLQAKGDARWRPRRTTAEIRPGRAGRTLDVSATVRALARAVADDRHDVRGTIRRALPETTEAEARAVRFHLGTFTTPFVPGQARVRNIQRMAQALDGVVVQPGGAFSLNAAAGPRTRAKGYVPAPSIADGELVDSVGGGVSQVATTLYNAAFFAGLRLDAHQPHSFYIDRYPPGREATLSFPEIDLRWTNDTTTPVVIRARVGPTSVTVDLFGDNGGRRVSAIVGRRRDAEDGAFSIDVTRVIRRAGAPPQRTTRTTTYEAPPDP